MKTLNRLFVATNGVCLSHGYWLLFVLSIMFSCNEDSNYPPKNIISVDITKDYSQIKQLVLQDFVDVEYIALETTDDFLNEGSILDIGPTKLLVINRQGNNGDIFIYDRRGNALRKINRKGQGGEEYTNIYIGAVLDESNEEIIINDISTQRILVYDLYGKYKRSFKHKNSGGSIFYTDIFNYNTDYLLCYDKYNSSIPFVLISKQDGSIIKEIIFPFKEKIFLQQQFNDGDLVNTVSPGPYRSIISYNGAWLLVELSSDTIYNFSDDLNLYPFLIRTPHIASMDPAAFLLLRLVSDQYIFMEVIINKYNWTSNRGFPRSFFMYDKNECVFSGYCVWNGDYTIKKEVYMNRLMPGCQSGELWQALPAHQLIESYNKGELKGRLKEIAATLDEDSNPVIMLIKHKQSNE